MHTRASNSELVEPLHKPERTLNRRLRRRNRRAPFEQRNEPPAQLNVVYALILDINYFRHFLDILENYNSMDDEPILADKQSGRPSRCLPSNTQPNPKGSSSKPYQPPQARNEHVNAIFTQSGMPNYGKFLTELVSNKQKLEQISSAFFIDKSSVMIQNKVPPKLGDSRSFLIPCNFSKAFLCNALADLGASINLKPYSLYATLSLKTLKPNKMSIRLADRSFQHPVGIAENMLVEVGKFTFLVDFVILEIEEDNKVPLILRRPFLHTADAVIRVKQK
ncbi:reverse transcriptase domain-containing protein [Tanacetum coccineum]